MKIVIKKEPLKYQEGGYEQFSPTDYKAAKDDWEKAKQEVKKRTLLRGRRGIIDLLVYDPIQIVNVSIAAALKTGRRFIEVEVMSENIVVPDIDCWFYIEIVYPWRLKNGQYDSDKILTDGDNYYLCRRDLAKSPFVLNTYSKTKIEEEIQRYVSTI